MDLRNCKLLAVQVVAAFLAAFSICPAAISRTLVQDDKQTILDAFYSLQIPFIENKGQFPASVRYYARTLGAGFFVTEDGRTVYAVSSDKDGESSEGLLVSESFPGVTTFLGNGVEPAAAQVHEFMGNIPSTWKGTISSYNGLLFGEVSPGIHLELRAYGDRLSRFFLVDSQAETGNLNVKIEGLQDIRVNEDGELEVTTGEGIVEYTRPVAYQQDNGEFKYVDVAYELRGDGYGFALGQYDETKELVIAPSVLSAPVAAAGALPAVEIDDKGNAFIGGSTLGPAT